MRKAAVILLLAPLAGCTNVLNGNPIANCRAAANCDVIETKPTYGPPHQAAMEPSEPYRPKPTPPR
jgi:hypothetical protein